MAKVVLASGGMDSFLLWRLYAPDDSTNVFIDVGQKYAYKERLALRGLAHMVPNFKIAEAVGPHLGAYERPSGIIPLRNAHLILTAAQLDVGDDILLGVVRDEINSDKSLEFMRAMADVLNVSWRAQYWTDGRTFTVQTPMRHLSKAEAVTRYIAAGYRLDDLLATVSCYDADELHCGRCPSCFKRWVALRLNGIDGQQRWASDPAVYGRQSGVLLKATRGEYPPARADEIIQAMGHR